MSRVLAGVAAASAALALQGAAAGAVAAPIARPNPALVEIRVDYVNGLTGPTGKPVFLAPLRLAVIDQAVADQQWLAYQTSSDLGGFEPAPVGQTARSSGGRTIVGRSHRTEIPPLSTSAGGGVISFAPLLGRFPGPPESGTQPVPGLGVPPAVTPPSNSNTVPPANGGFGGRKPPPPPPTTTTTAPTTTTKPPPPPPPTTTTTPPPTTTTAPPPTTTAPPTTTTPPTAGASCGTVGLTITSDHATCQLYAINMAPGGSVSEVLTVRNDSGAPFTLSLRAAGTTNQLWNDLQLGVWEANTAAPIPFPALLWWTTQDNTLTTLQAGESIRYELELYLPPAASNADQGKVAVIDLIWKAQG